MIRDKQSTTAAQLLLPRALFLLEPIVHITFHLALDLCDALEIISHFQSSLCELCLTNVRVNDHIGHA